MSESLPSTSVAPKPDNDLLFPNIPVQFQRLVAEMQHATGSLLQPESVDDRPLHGTTLYIATCTLETRFGTFRTHIFQDIIDKHYIIALAHGDIDTAEVLYTRLHSSCVTRDRKSVV